MSMAGLAVPGLWSRLVLVLVVGGVRAPVASYCVSRFALAASVLTALLVATKLGRKSLSVAWSAARLAGFSRMRSMPAEWNEATSSS